MDYQAILYNLLKPVVRAALRYKFHYRTETTGECTEGPGLLVAPHLFATDPVILGLATKTRLVAVYMKSEYMRKGREPTHILAIIFGIDAKSPNFKEKLYSAWDNNSTILVFPEGDMPRRVIARAQNGILHPGEIPVERWAQQIFELTKDYEVERKRVVNCQPCGLDYGEDIAYRYGYTFPQGKLVRVNFGDVVNSAEFDDIELSHMLMKNAAELSNRPYDDGFYKRMKRKSGK